MKTTPTPRTDRKQGLYECEACGNHVVPAEFARELERELAEAKHQLLAQFAREHLTCGWCGEMMSAPPGFTPPMTVEKLKKTVRLHLIDCPKHPIRETERELAEVREERDRLAVDFRYRGMVLQSCLDVWTRGAPLKETVQLVKHALQIDKLPIEDDHDPRWEDSRDCAEDPPYDDSRQNTKDHPPKVG